MQNDDNHQDVGWWKSKVQSRCDNKLCTVILTLHSFCMHFCFLVEKWILSGYKHRNWWSIWVEYDLMRYCIFPTRSQESLLCYLSSSSRSRFSRARKQSVKYVERFFDVGQFSLKKIESFLLIFLPLKSKSNILILPFLCQNGQNALFWRKNSKFYHFNEPH